MAFPLQFGSPTPVVITDGSGNSGTSANLPVIDASVGAGNATAPVYATEIGWVDGTGKLQPVSAANPLPTTASGGGGGSVTQGTVPWVVSNAGTFAVQASIAAAQKIEVYDGTNTATIKAASVAATATDTALVVTTNGSTTAGACANTSVTSTSSAVLAANVARREVMIINTDVVTVFLGLGNVPTATAYHVVLKPCTVAHDGTGGSFVSDVWKGAINAIVASTSGHVAITELT